MKEDEDKMVKFLERLRDDKPYIMYYWEIGFMNMNYLYKADFSL